MNEMIKISDSPQLVGVLFAGFSDHEVPRMRFDSANGSLPISQVIEVRSVSEGVKFIDGPGSRQLLVVVRSPIYVLARHLSSTPGEPVEPVIEEVNQLIHQLLRLIRRQRSRVSMITDHAIVTHLKETESGIFDVRGFRLSIDPASLNQDPHCPIATCISALAVRTYPGLSTSLEEFEAALLPMSGDTFEDNIQPMNGVIDAAVDHYQRYCELNVAMEGLKKDFRVSSRNEAKFSLRNIALLKEVAQMSERVDILTSKCAEQEAAVAAARNEIARMRKDLRTKEQHLASFKAKRDFHRAKRVVAEARIGELEYELAEVYRSTSWRITGLLRRLKSKYSQLRGSKLA